MFSRLLFTCDRLTDRERMLNREGFKASNLERTITSNLQSNNRRNVSALSIRVSPRNRSSFKAIDEVK